MLGGAIDRNEKSWRRSGLVGGQLNLLFCFCFLLSKSHK